MKLTRSLLSASAWTAIFFSLFSVGIIGNVSAKVTVDDPAGVLPEIQRNDSIATPEKYFGFPIGSRHLRHDQVTSYFHALAADSDRATIIEYGKTHGGRPLYVMAVSSPENILNLNQIRKSRAQLASGKMATPPDDAKLVMYMGYCVHGDEASAINAAPLVAYHLVSGESADLLEAIDQCVFLIDPALNPDGSDRFANWVNENRGRFASANMSDREHRQPWPGGRSNYYWFDLNRDWLPLVHPESQGRVALYHQWKPNVVLDYHEMGSESTYFFQPGVPTRNNPLAPEMVLTLTRKFAQRFSEAMDQANELYYTEENFDDFYIGKGSTYPDLNGSIGILFEQGSTRGLISKNQRGVRHFRDTVANQVRTSIAGIERIIELKNPLLEFQADFFHQSLSRGQQDATKAFLLTGTASRLQAAQDLLGRHQIKSYLNRSAMLIDGKTLDSGSCLIIPTAQPQYTLLSSLMQQDQTFQENIFYDVSAWHLPSAFGLQMQRYQGELSRGWISAETADGKSESRRSARDQQVERFPRSDYDLERVLGFAFSPVELDAPRCVMQLMQQEIIVNASLRPFHAGMEITDSHQATETEVRANPEGHSMPAGTFLILKANNQQRWRQVVRTMRRLARNSSIELVPLYTSRNSTGPDFGSGQIVTLPQCNPALIVGPGTTSTRAGSLWHFLDHRLEQPATLIDADQLGSTDLSSFSCVIMPAGSYGNWGAREVDALTDYARSGGTIIAIGSAVNWLTRNNIVTSGGSVARATPRRMLDGPGGDEALGKSYSDGDEDAATADDGIGKYRFADARDLRALESIAGALFMTRIDSTHPLGFGFPDESVPVFRDSTTVWDEPNNPLGVVARYTDVIAGYTSQRNRERIQGTSAVKAQNLGSGTVVMIADDPVFRGYIRSSERFLTNAMLLGPVLRIPAAPAD